MQLFSMLELILQLEQLKPMLELKLRPTLAT